MVARKPKPKTDVPTSSYKKVEEYFRKGSRKGVRFGTMVTSEGEALVIISPIEKGLDGKIYSVTREFNGKKSPVNITLSANKTRLFRDILDQTIQAAKAR